MTMLTWAGHDMTTPQLVYKWYKQQSDEQIAVLAAHNVWYGPAHLRPRLKTPRKTAPEGYISIRWDMLSKPKPEPEPATGIEPPEQPERFIHAIHIIEIVAAFAKITVADMKGRRRARYVCVPRQAAMYLAYTHCKHMSLPAIGRRMGGRDHSTVFHARNKVQADLDAGGTVFGAIVAHVERELGVR